VGSPALNTGQTCADLYIDGTLPVASDSLRISVRYGASVSRLVLSMPGWMPSDPADLLVCKFLSRSQTDSTLTGEKVLRIGLSG